jgi:cell surface protein SprA
LVHRIKYTAIVTLLVVIGAAQKVLAKPNSFGIYSSSFSALPQEPDTTKLPFPIPPSSGISGQQHSPLHLAQPSNITYKVEYNPATKTYTVYERVGGINVSLPKVMTEEEYQNFQFQQSMRSYWRERQAGESVMRGSGILPRLQVGGETFDRIFGSNVIEIIPQGTAELIFGITTNRTDNPSFTEDMRSNTSFDFQSKIQMNVVGNIGEKLKLDIKYNTEATFDFENNVKVEYTGFEDEIIQKIEAGNVSLPLPGTLITGSHSLFGVKTQLRFGKLTVTSIFSRQNGESQVIDVKGGAQVKDFSFQADEYEVNRHFFLSKYFRDTYNNALKNLPLVNSGVTITRVEVWVTNKSNNFDNSRNIIAFVDLGESQNNISNPRFTQPQSQPGLQPNNERNTLYLDMTQAYAGIRDISNVNSVLAPLADFVGGTDYEKLENARKLTTNEYSFHPELGYVSLNMSLNSDEILAVAYEYTYAGRTFKVGELSTSGIPAPEALFVKLLKGTNLSPKMPTWDLMMKNIYSLGAYQVDKQDFTLNVLYQNDITGTSVNYIPEGGVNIENKPLISVLNLDNLNSNNDAGADGMFDFIEGITIKASTGRLIFPVLEPFGSDLRSKISTNDIAKKYVYQELYDSTLAKARQVAEKNKFRMEGSYQSSSSSEISLNAPNVPKGSVTVTAGGAKLVEGMDFTVDYLMGTVKIINPVYMQSGTPIKISLESQALFNFQTKTLMGSHFDYKFSDNFNAGATIMNLTERPFTKKVSFGNEAISNTIWGLNTSYRTESPLLTKMVDWLPFIQTKEKSTITFDAEFAQFIPGHSSIIGKAGTVQVDDFEGGKTAIDLRSHFTWMYASTPQGQDNLFPEGNLNNNLAYNYKRAKLAWYIIDPLFLRNNSLTPGYIRRNPNLQSSHFVREIFESEIFPNRNNPQGIPTNISVLNLAFYPKEAGSYNYTTNVDANGVLANPQGNWGGIMRSLPDHAKDFETANIEYIEFWLMDPFVYKPNSTGGDLFFNLGDISEDILRDGKKFFEQGMPESGEYENTGVTAWGRYPTTQMLINAFSSNDRQFQDVGLDGLTTEAEKTFFANYLNALRSNHGEDSKVYQDALNDPSKDNYRYYQSDIYDAQEASILDRYKYYNNLDGNSPVSNMEQYSNLPDGEDVNGDKTMSETENYYQYKISLRPQEMVVGQNFITDKVTYNARLANGDRSEVAWYQFKVPKEEWDRKVGTIDDFKSIRFMRMFLRGFQDTVILRFATLDLVKSEWRKYNRALVQGQEGMPTGDFPDGTFEVSVVNIEENNTRTPVNYVLPPGVERITDPSQPQLVELNEQAMQLKVVDLANGDARAVFKSVTYDIRQYKRLQMFIHAEAIPGIPINNHELTAFIRLGTDYSNNYYEYEIPLALTPAGTYSNSKLDRLMVWPDENYIDIELERLIDAKLNRNVEMQKPGSQVTYTTVYVENDGNRKIKVTGNPSLSNVKVLMIGIRNPNSSFSANDDGIPKSGIVWINELRLTQFNDKGGWAANARVTTKLADLATVNASGETYKPGFGSIEKKVNERSLDDFYQYDLSSTIQVGRFFSEKPIVNIPLFVGYNESFANPEYNPLDPDVPLKDALEKATNKAVRDSINKISQEYSRRKSLSLTNVKINKSEGTPMPWDISNFAVSYAYSDQLNRNIRTEHRIQRNVRGSLTYSYNLQAKKVEPFKKVKWLSNPYLRLIKDFNFSYLPNQLAFRTELNRNYFEQQLRNISTSNAAASSANVTLLPTYSKDFTWNRNYVFNWDLSQALKFEFTANNNARIDEPLGIVDKYKDRDAYEHWKDSVWSNLKNLGRNINYNHQFSLTYNIPINKIPLFNWVTATGRYNGSYNWVAAPILAENSTFDPGNTIQNSNNIQLNSQLSFTSLYNKSAYLKKVNQKFDQRARGTQKQPKMVTVTQEIENVSLRENMARNVEHKLKTDNVTVKVFDENNNEVKVDLTVRSKSRIALKSEKAVAKAKVVIEGKVPETENVMQFLTEGAIRMLMGVKTISGNYTETNGTLLPGYKPKTEYLGMTDWGNTYAPGFPFVAGWQNEQFAWDAIRNGWLSNDTSLNQATVFSHNRTLDFRANIEPIPAFRIDLIANRSFSENRNDYYVADGMGGFISSQPMYTGNFSISTVTIGSAFEKVSVKNNYSSETFERFKEIRQIIALRFAEGRVANPAENYYPDSLYTNGFPHGYGPFSQEVLRQAFLAAYTNKSPATVGLAAFPAIPLPNWSITYDGLAKLKFFKKYLRTFSLRHTYRSTYTVGNYTTNLDYNPTSDGFSYVRNTLRDLVSQNDITNISISEQFNPLFGIDLGWNSSLTNKVEIKNSRTLSMSFSNNQLTEMRNWEYVVGVGYRFENLPLKFGRASGEERTLKSDLRVNTDFSLRKSTTILRKIEDNLSTPTAGQNILTIKTSAEYVVSEQVTVRAYFDRVVNKPVTSLTYPMANTSFGFSVRFTLVQ